MQEIFYIANLFGINLENDYIKLDVKEIIDSFNFDEFRRYAKEKINSKELEFKNPMQKLQSVANSFKIKHTESNNDTVELYCKKLIDKCRNLAIYAFNSLPDNLTYGGFVSGAKYSMFVNPETNDCIFSEKEKLLLDDVGGCKRWLIDYDENKLLEDMIKSVNKFKRLKENNLISAPKLMIGQRF